MTSQEAVRALRQRRTVLRDHEVCFTRPGVQLCTKPAALGWYPSAAATARDAMRVGRDEAPFGALVDRLRAWVSGVTVQWDRGPRAWRVTRVLDDWELQLARQGYALDRARLRSKLSRAILTYPRRDRLFPLEKR